MDYPESSSDLSWFECFVDPTVISKAISDPERRKQLPRLCIQFTEKGFLAEKEKDKGKLAIEELMLFERKAASMRLCAMAIFAALDYDIDFIIDNITRNELLTLRVLADNFYKIYNEKNLDATFGNWLFYRFVLSIDRRNRLPPPAPTATIPSTYTNGQLMPTDPALIRHEKVQRMIMELREHVLKARAFISELAEEPREVTAPGIQCFLRPFVELAPKAMSAALIGDRNVLIENPSPNFEFEKVTLPASDVANKCLSELVTFLFTAGDLVEARKMLARVGKPTFENPIVAIDEQTFRAYSMILNVKGAFIPANSSTTIKPFVFDQKVLSDYQSMNRKSELYRQRGVSETSGQLQQVFQTENAAMSVIDGHPDCIRDKLKNKAQCERFVKVLKKQMDAIPRTNRSKLLSIRAQLQYLCATVFELREMLQSGGLDVTDLRTFVVGSPSVAVEAPPTREQLYNLIRCKDPFWSLMTEFDIQPLREAVAGLGRFWFPSTMRTSEFLADILDTTVASPTHSLQRVLLAKLEQLSRMRNSDGFLKRLTHDYFVEFGGSTQWVLMATFESINVHASIGNHQCHLASERKILEVNAEQTSLIFKPDFKPTESSAKMINQCLALMLNVGEARTVLEKGGHISIEIFKCVPVARILGAYLFNLDDVTAQKKCADGLWRTVTVKFIEAQPLARGGARRGGDAALEAKLHASRKEMSMLMHLLTLIRHPRLVDFLLAYAVCLHNRLVSGQKRSQFKIHAKLLDLYLPDPNAPKLDISNLDDVRQLLRMMCEKAYTGARTDPDSIRTYADFLYTEKDWQGAGEKYMEYFVAHSPTLRVNVTDTSVFDDSVVHRLRICLAHSGYLTMSMLMCQLLKTNRSSEYQKAMHLLRNNETRDVGANCSEFVTDTTAIELLSQLYQQNRMSKSLATLYTGASSLAANKNVPGTLCQQEVNRRTNKLLSSIASVYFGMHT